MGIVGLKLLDTGAVGKRPEDEADAVGLGVVHAVELIVYLVIGLGLFTLENVDRVLHGLDIDGAIQKEMATAMKLQNANTLPIFLIADTFNRVVFVSQGYTIGLGEQLMKVIHKL